MLEITKSKIIHLSVHSKLKLVLPKSILFDLIFLES
jgi:hypothetical protein